jgi:hypothetical protein
MFSGWVFGIIIELFLKVANQVFSGLDFPDAVVLSLAPAHQAG